MSEERSVAAIRQRMEELEAENAKLAKQLHDLQNKIFSNYFANPDSGADKNTSGSGKDLVAALIVARSVIRRLKNRLAEYERD